MDLKKLCELQKNNFERINKEYYEALKKLSQEQKDGLKKYNENEQIDS